MIDPLDPTTLKSAREAAGLSCAELAEQSGVHTTTIRRIEAGKVDPHVDGTWAPIVRALSKDEDSDVSPAGRDAA
jgi:predicted transcriptional regulator